MTALRTAFTPDHREWLVREILAAPQEVRHTELGQQLGCSRETVRRVRFGLMWGGIAPELERQPRERTGAVCTGCRLFEAKASTCSQGYPRRSMTEARQTSGTPSSARRSTRPRMTTGRR